MTGGAEWCRRLLYQGSGIDVEAFTPLCPVGHLPHKGGDQLSLLPLHNLQHFQLCKGVDVNVISPLVGEMSDRTEGGERLAEPLFVVRQAHHEGEWSTATLITNFAELGSLQPMLSLMVSLSNHAE
ncbi:hypothetical protein SAMN05443582_101211 [Phyllobacterium sp. OV277]|nr:hypothetical protein SAMN05443582_101211 [Phyllobacterium sp. OV277]